MIDINSFASRHIGPRNEDINNMLEVVKCKSLDELILKTVPDHILFKDKLKLRPGMSEEFNKVNMQLLSLKNKFNSLSNSDAKETIKTLLESGMSATEKQRIGMFKIILTILKVES